MAAGGELTLEMLDLRYDPPSNFYEAPLHMKALGGCFVIDDFGRQLVSPTTLLNRWIVPLESRIDYLKLHTGKSFSIPFDELVIFSTNLEPEDLMDPAFLRRLPYKIEIGSPSVDCIQANLREGVHAAGLTCPIRSSTRCCTRSAKRRSLSWPRFNRSSSSTRWWHPAGLSAACDVLSRVIDYAIDNLKVKAEETEQRNTSALV